MCSFLYFQIFISLLSTTAVLRIYHLSSCICLDQQHQWLTCSYSIITYLCLRYIFILQYLMTIYCSMILKLCYIVKILIFFYPPGISAVDIGMVVIGTPSCRVSKAGIQASSLQSRFHMDRYNENGHG